MRKLQLAMILCGLFALCGCGRSYHAQLEFNDNCWSIKDTLAFSYGKGEAEILGIDLNMLPDYEYMNIHLKLLLETPSGKISAISMNDTLIDPLGNWQIEPSWGEYTLSVYRPVLNSLNEEGAYRLKLIHNMRDDDLCNIKSVGVYFQEKQTPD